MPLLTQQQLYTGLILVFAEENKLSYSLYMQFALSLSLSPNILLSSFCLNNFSLAGERERERRFTLNKMVREVLLLTCIQELPGSNLERSLCITRESQ
jgi:hypothetical protein